MTSQMSYQPEWVREDFIDFIAEKINPRWAWKRIKATLVLKKALSHDFFEIHLNPNHHFKASTFKAGQSIAVTLVMGGVRLQRHYSIVEILPNGHIVIAVRVQGRVSRAITELACNSVIEISQPQGEFILPPQNSVKDKRHVLLVASGSGITSIYALLAEALKQKFEKIDLIYFTRDDAFHVKLQQLAQLHPNFDYHHINTKTKRQHLDLDFLEITVPHFKSVSTYACGAQSMMQSLMQIYRQLGIQTYLQTEYFQAVVDENLASQPVVFLRAQQQFEATQNLLLSAEQAGLKPAHGCRMGICNTCTCTKVSGSTKNLLTGEIDHDANTPIKLCISQAVSPVVINL